MSAALHDQGANLYPLTVLAPAVISADNTPAAIDIQGYGAATLLLYVGVGGITFSETNKVEFLLTHSEDNSTYTAVTLDHINGVADAELTAGAMASGKIKSLIAAHAAAAWYKFRYVGGRRYLKLLADFSGTHGTGTLIGAHLILGRPAFSTVTV